MSVGKGGRLETGIQKVLDMIDYSLDVYNTLKMDMILLIPCYFFKKNIL